MVVTRFYWQQKKTRHIPVLPLLIDSKPMYRFTMHHNSMIVNCGTRERICATITMRRTHWQLLFLVLNLVIIPQARRNECDIGGLRVKQVEKGRLGACSQENFSRPRLLDRCRTPLLYKLHYSSDEQVTIFGCLMDEDHHLQYF